MLKSNSEVDLTNINASSLVILFLVGIIASATMVIPGISGSFVLMLLGFYEPIVNTIRSLTNFSLFSHNIIVLGIFGIGILIGIVLVSKLIEMLLKKYETKIRSVNSLVLGGRLSPFKVSHSPDVKFNQDCIYANINLNTTKLDEISLFCIFDGNGQYGKSIAQALKNYVVNYF